MKKFKENPNSQLSVKFKMGEGVDQFGRTFIETKWFKATKEVNLGSMAKPNKEILAFKYNVPNENESFLSKMFSE